MIKYWFCRDADGDLRMYNYDDDPWYDDDCGYWTADEDCTYVPNEWFADNIAPGEKELVEVSWNVLNNQLYLRIP